MTYKNANPKPETYKNEDYLKFIRTLPCVICGKPAEPCHVRKLIWGAGTSQKSHSYVCVPGCRQHHNYVEKLVNVELIIIDNLMKYIESKRKRK